MSETFEQMAIRKWQEVCKSLSVGAPVAIKFAAAICDELAKGAEPVAWMNSRNGFIAKENKNPEYSVGLYTCPPSAAARIAELEGQLAEKDADIERLYRAIDANWVSQKQIVVSQLRVKQLREATECLLHLCEIIGAPEGAVLDKARHALATPADTTALQSLLTKAGEVMRERCIEVIDCEAIRALPAITLDDLKGGAA